MNKISREQLYDFGHKIETNEMKRDFYLKNRIAPIERKNMLDVFRIVRSSAIKNKLGLGHAILGVGTSTYSNKYYEELEKYLLEEGFGREDFIEENAGYYGNRFDNFDEYKKWTEEENTHLPWDEQIRIMELDEFSKIKNGEQSEYKIKKRVGDILDKKGEDLDFIVCLDSFNSCYHEEYDKKMEEFKINFENLSKESDYKIFKEESYLSGANYNKFPGDIVRSKSIEDRVSERRESYKIDFDKGRSFHFYFDKAMANHKVRRERIDENSFVQLIRKGNFLDLESAIKNGEKNDIYENPEILRYLKK